MNKLNYVIGMIKKALDNKQPINCEWLKEYDKLINTKEVGNNGNM